MATVIAEPYEYEFHPDTTALLMIDFQRDFVDPGGFGQALGNDVSLLRRAVPPAERVLKAARAQGLMVIHTREGHRPDLACCPPSKKARGRLKAGIGDPGPMGRILVRGEHGHDIVKELYPEPGEPIVDKPGKGAFYATDLHAILGNRGIQQLIVCGVTTEVCVNTTVREANDRGYDCLVLPRVSEGRTRDGQGTRRDLRLGLRFATIPRDAPRTQVSPVREATVSR